MKKFHIFALLALVVVASGCIADNSTTQKTPEVNDTSENLTDTPEQTTEDASDSSNSESNAQFVILEAQSNQESYQMGREFNYTLEVGNGGTEPGAFEKEIVFRHKNITDMFERQVTTDVIQPNTTVRINHTVSIPLMGEYKPRKACCGPPPGEGTQLEIGPKKVGIDETVTTKDGLEISIGDLRTEVSGNQEYTIFPVEVSNTRDSTVEAPLYEEFTGLTTSAYEKHPSTESNQTDLYQQKNLNPDESISGTVALEGNIQLMEDTELTGIRWKDESKPIGYIWEI